MLFLDSKTIQFVGFETKSNIPKINSVSFGSEAKIRFILGRVSWELKIVPYRFGESGCSTPIQIGFLPRRQSLMGTENKNTNGRFQAFKGCSLYLFGPRHYNGLSALCFTPLQIVVRTDFLLLSGGVSLPQVFCLRLVTGAIQRQTAYQFCSTKSMIHAHSSRIG